MVILFEVSIFSSFFCVFLFYYNFYEFLLHYNTKHIHTLN